jgi:hypothetical protein
MSKGKQKQGAKAPKATPVIPVEKLENIQPAPITETPETPEIVNEATEGVEATPDVAELLKMVKELQDELKKVKGKEVVLGTTKDIMIKLVWLYQSPYPVRLTYGMKIGKNQYSKEIPFQDYGEVHEIPLEEFTREFINSASRQPRRHFDEGRLFVGADTPENVVKTNRLPVVQEDDLTMNEVQAIFKSSPAEVAAMYARVKPAQQETIFNIVGDSVARNEGKVSREILEALNAASKESPTSEGRFKGILKEFEAFQAQNY